MALLSAAPVARADVEIYRPSHRPADELAAIGGPLLGPGGLAMADPGTGAVILRGERPAIARALATLRELDLPPSQFRVFSRVERRGRLGGAGVDVSGWVRIGDLSVGRVPAAPDDGVRLSGHSYRTGGAERRESQVLVLEGHAAEIWTGTSYPVRVRHFDLLGGDERVVETMPLVPVRSGFRVRPRGLPDGGIELAIVPIVSRRGPYGEISETSAASRVRLQPGEQIVVASTGRDAQASSDGLLHTGDYESADETVFLVSAVREDVGEPAVDVR